MFDASQHFHGGFSRSSTEQVTVMCPPVALERWAAAVKADERVRPIAAKRIGGFGLLCVENR